MIEEGAIMGSDSNLEDLRVDFSDDLVTAQ